MTQKTPEELAHEFMEKIGMIDEADEIEADLAALIREQRREAREEALEAAAHIAESHAPPSDQYPMTPYGACVAVSERIRALNTEPSA